MVDISLTRAWAVFAGILALAGPVAAQPAPGAAAPEGQPPVHAHIQALEEALGVAVSRSANAVENQLPAGVPGLVLFAGPIQVRGFRLADYGVFFDVEYPVLRRSIVWSMQRLDPFEMSLDITLQMLRRRFRSADVPIALPDGRRPVLGRPGVAQAPLERVGGPAARRSAETRYAPSAGDAAPAGAGRVAGDPQRVYRGALRASLTDALLLNGGRAGRPASRGCLGSRWPRGMWRGSGGRDSQLRVRALELVALGEGRRTLEEVRDGVEISGF